MNIGQRIKQRRKELQISAEDLADLLKKDKSTIYRYEKGDIENIPSDILNPIAKALNTSPSYLMGWDEEENDINKKRSILLTAASYYGINVPDLENIEKYISYLSQNNSRMNHLSKWLDAVGHVELTDDETDKIIEFSKFLLYQRDN